MPVTSEPLPQPPSASLSPLRKAAVLLASLEGPAAAELLARLPQDEAQRLKQAAAQAGPIDPAEQRAIWMELVQQRRRAADGSLPDGLPEASCGAKSPLDRADPARLAAVLRHERPAVIAVVLSRISSRAAAQVLERLGGDLQRRVVRRLVQLDDADPQAVEAVHAALQATLAEDDQRARGQRGWECLQEILRAADPKLGGTILSSLAPPPAAVEASGDEPLAEVDRLGDAAWAVVLAAAEPELAQLTLAGWEPARVQRTLRHVPPSLARRLRAALEELGPTPLSDVERAQQEARKLAARLLASGRIQAARPRFEMAA